MVLDRQDAVGRPKPAQIQAARKPRGPGHLPRNESRLEGAAGIAHDQRLPRVPKKRARRDHFAFVHMLMICDQHRRPAFCRQITPLADANLEEKVELAHAVGDRRHRPVGLHRDAVGLRTATTAPTEKGRLLRLANRVA